ncbi:MAG TPA: Rieske 2Fe-2S domain-containing protein [Acidimicrobiales bacterium]|nr:Rieske 2Fe-2S domain-containing protein [Acidimicrobiales bacterium]
MTTVPLGRLADYEVGVPRSVPAPGRTLVVVRIEGSLYVLDDRCSHEDFPLSQGYVDVEAAEIECARHGALFSLVDGEPLSLPATRPVAHYEVREANGQLVVEVP